VIRYCSCGLSYKPLLKSSSLQVLGELTSVFSNIPQIKGSLLYQCDGSFVRRKQVQNSFIFAHLRRTLPVSMNQKIFQGGILYAFEFPFSVPKQKVWVAFMIGSFGSIKFGVFRWKWKFWKLINWLYRYIPVLTLCCYMSTSEVECVRLTPTNTIMLKKWSYSPINVKRKFSWNLNGFRSFILLHVYSITLCFPHEYWHPIHY